MDSSQAQSPPPVPLYGPTELPSSFLSTPFTAPPAPLQPSDLYGARLKVTLNHVKSEISSMRVDLEGVMQIRDELDSLRKELALVRTLVDAQGDLFEKRVLEGVSSLFDSKFAPLFDSLLESSASLSSTFKVYEGNQVTRARAQNVRIEEVESSNKRSLEEVERQLASTRTEIKQNNKDLSSQIEVRVEEIVSQKLEQISGEIIKRAQDEIAKGVELVAAKQEEVHKRITQHSKAIQDRLATPASLHLPSSSSRVEAPPAPRASSDVATPLSSAVRSSSSPPSSKALKNPKVVDLPKSTPSRPSAAAPPGTSPPSPPRRRPRLRTHSQSHESKSPLTSKQQASHVGPAESGDTRGLLASTIDKRVSVGLKGNGSSAALEGKHEKGSRQAGRRFIAQDPSQNQEASRTGTVDTRKKDSVASDIEEAEPDTIE